MKQKSTFCSFLGCFFFTPGSYYSTLNKVLKQDVVVLPPGVRDVTKANRKEAPLVATLGPSLLQSWLWPEDWASLARREDFPIPCPAFRCSLICRLYFYLPSPPAPGLSAFTRLLMSIRWGSGCLGRPAAPIKGLSAGDWACCPPLAPQALFSSTFPRLAPDDA